MLKSCLVQAFTRFGDRWRWGILFFIALIPRLLLLRVYDVELSQDGFDAVNTLTILQTQGAGAIPRELFDRFILHPLYMLELGTLRFAVPEGADFYLAARLLSAAVACIAIIAMFAFTRKAFDETAAWIAALFLAFAPSFLWESVAILSSTLFLSLYLSTLLALNESHHRIAALLAFLSAITRYEGIVLIALVLVTLLFRTIRAHRIQWAVWSACAALAFAFPLTLMAVGWLATGNALEFIGAQSMASIWLRFLAPGDFLKRGAFFVTQYPTLFPAPIVWLGLLGAILAIIRHRRPATALLLGLSLLYLLFFETLVWLNYTTLETRFLMYPGLPLLVFAGVALADAHRFAAKFSSSGASIALSAVVVSLLLLSFQQGDLGIRFVYNMMASQREMADELVQLVPANRKTNLMVYAGNSGALAFYGKKYGLDFSFTYFRYAPDDDPEQFLIERQVQFIVYPVGNAFAKAKYPYLARFETQTHGAVTFQPLTQFATSTDNQLYSIWLISY